MRTGAGVVVTRDGELGLGSAFPWEDVKHEQITPRDAGKSKARQHNRKTKQHNLKKNVATLGGIRTHDTHILGI